MPGHGDHPATTCPLRPDGPAGYVDHMAPVLLLLLSACTPTGRAWRLDSVQLAADPPALDFAPVPLGQLATETITLTNSGTSSVALTLSVPEPFRVDRASVELGAGGSSAITVSFAPVDYAAAAATLAVSGGASLEIPLTGTTDPDSDADGHAALDAGGDDCDDGDPAVNPEAPEVCYDGVDADCDGLTDDSDCDGDGAPVDVDCDDTDPTVAPTLPEAGPDGRDDDCDGLVDENLHTAGALFFSEVSPGPTASLELCNGSPEVVYLDHLRLVADAGAAELDPADARDPSPLDPGTCAAFALQATGYFSWPVSLAVDPAGDTLSVWSGEVELDRVVLTGAWGWEADVVEALAADHGNATDNDDAGSWCRPSAASWGSPTPDAACP